MHPSLICHRYKRRVFLTFSGEWRLSHSDRESNVQQKLMSKAMSKGDDSFMRQGGCNPVTSIDE